MMSPPRTLTCAESRGKTAPSARRLPGTRRRPASTPWTAARPPIIYRSPGRPRPPAMRLTDLTWPAVAALPRDTPVVVPVAALEQHGRHLPTFTDSLLCGEIVRRAEERLADRVLVAPLLWLGNSDHHLDFAGTLSAPPRTYLDVLGGLIDNFVRHGFRRLVF